MKILSVFLLLAIPFYGSSQNLHADLFAGIATYQGDLQDKIFAFNQSLPAYGLGISYDISDKFIVRTGFTYGEIEGSDKKITTIKGLDLRNLRFKTSISELHAGVEYNFLKLENTKITPYIFGGLAVFHFNPYTYDIAGNKFYLKPLSTEGQGLAAYPDRKEYKLTQIAIPFGGGLKFKVTDNLQVAVEFGLRKLFIDYLDDVSSSYVDKNILQAAKGSKAVELAFRQNETNPVEPYPSAGSQRGNLNAKDWYYFSGLRISKLINGNGGNNSGNRSGKIGCPQKVF